MFYHLLIFVTKIVYKRLSCQKSHLRNLAKPVNMLAPISATSSSCEYSSEPKWAVAEVIPFLFNLLCMTCAMSKLMKGRSVIFFNLSKILHRWNIYVVYTRLVIGSTTVVTKARRIYIPFYNVFCFFYRVMFIGFLFLALALNTFTLVYIKNSVVSK